VTRSRTISWEDPVETFGAATAMSGLEYLEAIRDGDLPPPPFGALMGIRPVELEEGRVVFAATPEEYHYSPIGLVHGGLAVTLLDSAMGGAVQTRLPAGTGYTTLEIKVNFARAMTRDTGPVLAEGRVVHAGRKVVTTEGRVIAEDSGKLLAHGTSTCLVLSPNGAAQPTTR
jgi:uncharacterized protein (TIGR00369 family)